MGTFCIPVRTKQFGMQAKRVYVHTFLCSTQKTPGLRQPWPGSDNSCYNKRPIMREAACRRLVRAENLSTFRFRWSQVWVIWTMRSAFLLLFIRGFAVRPFSKWIFIYLLWAIFVRVIPLKSRHRHARVMWHKQLK